MSARGILANPAMYAGYESTPICCIKDWVGTSCLVRQPIAITVKMFCKK